MAGKKISELSALGANFVRTDLFEISSTDGGGFVSRKITAGEVSKSIIDPGTGGTEGSVLFVQASLEIGQDNTNFFWNDTTNCLGIGVNDPDAPLEILNTSAQLKLSYDGSNFATLYCRAGGDITISDYTTLNRKFTKTAASTAEHDGDVVYIGTGATTAGTLYYFDGTDWVQTNASTASSAAAKGLLGIALGADSDVDGVLLRGMVTLDHDPGTTGDILYVSDTSAGDITSVIPATAGDTVRIVGYCLDSGTNQIWFNPDNTYITV